jgi:diadenosine tetraphosphatase ApaH/serine/threonine PP2A family protein phosphatase
VNGDVLENQITQSLGRGDRDVQVEVVGAGHMKDLLDAWDSAETVEEFGHSPGVVAAEPDLDHRL